MLGKFLKAEFASLTVVSVILGMLAVVSSVDAAQLRDAQPALMKLMDANITCTKDEETGSKCAECKKEVQNRQKKTNSAANRAITEDDSIVAGASACADTGTETQRRTHRGATNTNSCSAQQQRARDAIARALQKEAKECREKIKEACGSEVKGDAKKAADKAEQACKEMEQKAQQAGNERGKEAKEMDKNGDQAKNNEKKGESAGGMPQMPQMPQQQQGQETPQQQPTDYPTATSPTPNSENKPEQVAASKFDEDKDKTAIPAVGFGNTTPTDTATVTAPGNSFSAQGIDPNLRGLASNFGSGDDKAGVVAASASPPGGGGGGGLGGNSSGASSPAPGGATAEKTPDPNNPYEVPVGSGGRLGAPKGKTGGESDTALDAAATANFKDDFKSDGSGGGSGELAGAGEDEDPGYTIFKMVRYRYVELKKKGNI